MASTDPTPQFPANGSADTLRKFGTFGGVFTPSILTILGVIMFLRLGRVVGQAGADHSGHCQGDIAAHGVLDFGYCNQH